EEKLYRYVGLRDFSIFQGSEYYNLLIEIQRLCHLQKCDEPVDMHWSLSRYVKAKKLHEINRLLNPITRFFHQHRLEEIIDVGGGVGYLAHGLVLHSKLPVQCLDKDDKLQASGEKRFFRIHSEHSDLL